LEDAAESRSGDDSLMDDAVEFFMQKSRSHRLDANAPRFGKRRDRFIGGRRNIEILDAVGSVCYE
jgi:hypothetical protein